MGPGGFMVQETTKTIPSHRCGEPAQSLHLESTGAAWGVPVWVRVEGREWFRDPFLG